jgi:pimeloyl-ACP methyl ester carboxylesterase
MISQTKAVSNAYQAHGGKYQEEVIVDCGHSPHIEKPEIFRQVLFEFLGQQAPKRGLAEDLTQVVPYVANI